MYSITLNTVLLKRAVSHSPIRSPQPPTRAPPFRSISPAARNLNSSLISTNIYPGLTFDGNSSMTHTSEV
uniref:Ovule protein n=1 Tax=Mesocestoides corti TaxID=53468 RepID=A0A5K3FU28_MESCO